MRTLIASSVLTAAVLLAVPAVAQQQLSGTEQFCLQGATGPIKCEFQTMAACEQAKPAGSADQCVNRSQAESTVGSGQGSAMPDPATPTGKDN